MSTRTYKMARAEVTVIYDELPALVRSVRVSRIANIAMLKKSLSNALLSDEEKQQLRNEITDERAKFRRSFKRNVSFQLKLTEPKFCGYTKYFDGDAHTDDFNLFRRFIRGRVTETIRQCRRHRIEQILTNELFAGTFVSCMGRGPGRVFALNNTVFKCYVEKHMQELFSDKKPTEAVKYIGIELEFCSRVTQEELAVRLFKAGLHKVCQLKADGSLRPLEKERGYEIALLLKESTYKKDLKTTLDILKSIDAQANDRRCGLHVHLDMRQRNKNMVFNNLVACQKMLLRLVDPSRYNNEFCQLVRKRTPPINFTGNRQERYKTINAASYYKYQTLEVRMHEGSVDYAAIVGWTDLLVKIANCRKKLTKTVSTLTMLKRMLNLNEKLFSYAVDRNCYWQLRGSARQPRRRDFVFQSTVAASAEAYT